MSTKRLRTEIMRAEQAVEENRVSTSQGRLRQHYHFMPPTGWLNDPNGLIYFHGNYHIFYQYNPYTPEWGAMHWGHAISQDCVHWEHLSIALAPSEEYDTYERGGCFSGSALEYQGKLWLIYTGSTFRNGKSFQTQCLAYSEDGIHFTKYKGNPVLEAPPEYDPADFRDPKVWRQDPWFYLICGAKRNGFGTAPLFRSRDLFSWEYMGTLMESRGEWGSMWECPDLFRLEGRWVFTFSPYGTGERKTVYMVGDLDCEKGKFYPEREGEIDWGCNYYAPQTMLDDKGRRILFGWAGEWDWMPWWSPQKPTKKEGWAGHFCLPRKIGMLPDGSLNFCPLEELKALRGKSRRLEMLQIREGETCSLPEGVALEVQVVVDLEDTDAARCVFTFRSAKQKCLKVVLDFDTGELLVDRREADEYSKGCSRSSFLPTNDRKLDLHIFMDQCSVEVFANQYRTVHSCNFFPAEDQTVNQITAVGGTVRLRILECWEIKRIVI